jgi:lipopolysaccharide/colanic/teichoic acid biosynthesis glycosyltransferase
MGACGGWGSGNVIGEEHGSDLTPSFRAVRQVDADSNVVATIDSVIRRLFDVLLAAVLLVLAVPLFLLVIAGIVVESSGPVLYRSRRVGRDGVEFDMLKFRKMRHGATGPPLTAADDDRFTRIGVILSRTKLDELPQLWNVLRGDMGLVGPRPESPVFVQACPDLFDEVLTCRPGITGPSQLAFAKEAQILARPELEGRYLERLLPAKLEIDLLYVRGRSLVTDLRILAWTCAALLLRVDVAVDRATGGLSIRRRPGPTTAEARGTAER